jgi:hypothetical protein
VTGKKYKDCCISDQYDGMMGRKLGMLAMKRKSMSNECETR